MSKAKTVEKELEPINIRRGRITFPILGNTPLIYHALSEKTKQSLLKPSGRKTAAERATTLKHEPMREYRDSFYQRKSTETGPTRLLIPCRMFHAAMCEAAKRIPGSSATEMKQLLSVEGQYADLYGTPQILMSVVRQGDIARTPDIRTRAIVERWACTIVVTYVQPHLTADTVSQLLGAAGVLMGIGDWRKQKGGEFGQFDVVDANDARFRALVKNEGVKVQDQAIRDPVRYDQETEAMLDWFDDEMAKTDHRAEHDDDDEVQPVKRRKRKSANGAEQTA